MMFILELLALVISYESSYTTESYATVTSSPAKLKFTKGLALMIVEWPEAIISISIPGVLSSPKILTQKDGFSLFTFSDAATVEITFKSAIKYFVIACPQENSKSGAVQFISNMKSNTVTENGHSYDFYFSVYSEYSMKGKIEISGFLGGSLKYQIDNQALSTSDLNSINLSPLRFTSKLIRTGPSSDVSFSQLSIISSEIVQTTIPMYKFLQWNSVDANNNNFLSNSAYGPDNKESLIKDITPEEIRYEIKVTVSLDSDVELGCKVDGEENLEHLSGMPSFTKYHDHPFKIQFYVKYKLCQNFVKIPEKYIDVNSFITPKQVTITNDDIPIQCKAEKKTYYVNIKNSISAVFSYQLAAYDRNDNLVQITKVNPYKDSVQAYEPFTVDIYFKADNCKTQKIATITATETEQEYIIEDSHIPQVCIPYSTCYVFDLPSGYTVGYKYSDAEDSEIKEETQINLKKNTQFSIILYLLTSQYCEPNKEWMTLEAKKELTLLSCNFG